SSRRSTSRPLPASWRGVEAMNTTSVIGVHTAAQPAEAQAATAARVPWGFPELFVISQTALPALLYLPGSQGFRLAIRASAFAISLGAFLWWQFQPSGRPPPHP